MAHIFLRDETKKLAERFPVAENGIDFDEVALQKMLDELFPAPPAPAAGAGPLVIVSDSEGSD